MLLSPDQIKSIKEILDAHVTLVGLHEDLVDHLCCVVEIKLRNGKEFDGSLREALAELAPDGLERIEHETLFLLNSNKIMVMKKVMYAIGMLSVMSFATGYLFAIMNFSGATILQLSGFFGFVFMFIPLYAIDRYKISVRQNLSERLKLIIGVASGFLIGLSVVFKLLHLQGTQTLLLFGFGIFVLGFIPFLFFTLYKKSVA